MNEIIINEVNLYYNIGDISYYECIKQLIMNETSQYNNQYFKKKYINTSMFYDVRDNIHYTNMSIYIPMKIFLTIISDIYSELDLSYIISINVLDVSYLELVVQTINAPKYVATAPVLK